MLEVAGVAVTAILVWAVTVMAAAADLVESAIEVAVSVSVPEGTDVGAGYMTLAPDKLVVGETVPQVLAVQAAPDSAQLTPLFWMSFVMGDMKVFGPLSWTGAVVWGGGTGVG